MKYSHVKSGLGKLFLAELLTIAASFSITFNGETEKIIGIVLSFIGAAAFIVNLIGLKQCMRDDKAYQKAYICSIAGLLVWLAVTILSVILTKPEFTNYADNIEILFAFIVAFIVLKNTAPILRECGKEAEAKYADKVRWLYTGAFVIGELLSILANVISNDVLKTVAIFLAIAALIVLLVAQIKYIIFLRKSSNAI